MDPATAILASSGIGAAGSLVGGLMGWSGAKDANKRNLQIAREQMAFQERMSGTAYQRAAKDLEAAGLNRILAFGKPASTPPGAAQRMENEKAPIAAGMQNAANIAANTALQISQAKNLDARTQALGGAAAVGTELGKLVDWITGKTTGGNIEPAGMLDRFITDAANIIDKVDWMPTGTSSPNKNNEKAATTAGTQEAVQNVLNQYRNGTPQAKQTWQLLIDQVKQMDQAPKGLTDEQYLTWGIENIKKVKAFRERQGRFK